MEGGNTLSDSDFDEFVKPTAEGRDPAAMEPFRPLEWDAEPVDTADLVRRRHEAELMEVTGVTGVGLGASDGGDEVILVYVHDAGVTRRLPSSLEGVPVQAIVTGSITAR